MPYDTATKEHIDPGYFASSVKEKDNDPFGDGMEQINAANEIIENLMNERSKMREQIGVLSQNVVNLTDRLRKFQAT